MVLTTEIPEIDFKEKTGVKGARVANFIVRRSMVFKEICMLHPV